MGQPPFWYRIIKAARYLGVAPWELSQRPLTWLHYAEASLTAETAAEEASRKRQVRQAKKQR